MKEVAMTHADNTDSHSLYVLMSSPLGTLVCSLLGTLISLLAVWHVAASGLVG